MRLAQDFEAARGVRVDVSVASSSTLARQIADGAPADVFLSASRAWIEHLRAARSEFAQTEPRVFAGNGLVCIAPSASELALAEYAGLTFDEQLARLARELGPSARIAIADVGVPAGEYARQALGEEIERFASRWVGREHVRAVLGMVAAGEADAGWVYASDALAADVHVLFEVPPDRHDPIELLALISGPLATRALAQEFVDSLGDASAREVLTDAGFRLPASNELTEGARADE